MRWLTNAAVIGALIATLFLPGMIAEEWGDKHAFPWRTFATLAFLLASALIALVSAHVESQRCRFCAARKGLHRLDCPVRPEFWG